MRPLRLARRRVALLAAVAELAGSWSLEQQMAALSRFAEAAIGAALRHLLRARRGKRRDSPGRSGAIRNRTAASSCSAWASSAAASSTIRAISI